jgi:hypothetical protein
MFTVVLGVVVLVVIVGFLLLLKGGGGGRALKPGSRAWEASLTVGPLLGTIEARKLEMAGERNQRKQIRLTKEIAFLEKQVPELQAIIAANDGSPGRGYVGFEPYRED